jgi:hypothetical protein
LVVEGGEFGRIFGYSNLGWLWWIFIFDSLKRKILTVWKGKFWQFGKENFDSLERKILTVWKWKFWQFENENFDSLERKILTVWKGKFWQFENENFDSLERKILTVWKWKFWQFGKENFDSWKRKIFQSSQGITIIESITIRQSIRHPNTGHSHLLKNRKKCSESKKNPYIQNNCT